MQIGLTQNKKQAILKKSKTTILVVLLFSKNSLFESINYIIHDGLLVRNVFITIIYILIKRKHNSILFIISCFCSFAVEI
ncbi:MAG: hypothetical protein ACI9FW_000343 [Flavobacterium sp.]|jgi:hypothetical protein